MKRHDQTKGTQRSQKGGNSQSKDIGQHESDKNRTRTAVPTIDNASGPAPPGGRVVIAHALYRMRAQWGVKFEYLVRTQPRAHPLLYASTPRKIHSQKRQMGMPAPGPSHAISGSGPDRSRRKAMWSSGFAKGKPMPQQSAPLVLVCIFHLRPCRLTALRVIDGQPCYRFFQLKMAPEKLPKYCRA